MAEARRTDEPALHEESRDWDTTTRVARLLDVVQSFAAMDFSRAAPVGHRGDDLDALAAGINILGEEVEASRRELEERVEERTAELTGLTHRLESEIGERRRAEEQLTEANAQLNGWVEHLEWLNRQVGRLTEMSNLFQVAASTQEAFAVIGQFGPELFTGTEGEVFVFVPSRDVLELAASWGDATDQRRTLQPDGCWALRRGRLHRGRGDAELSCGHLPAGTTGITLCLPLTAQGETLGLLHLRWSGDAGERSTTGGGPSDATGAEYERLAVAASEQIALSLANLELRAALRAQSIRDPLTGLYNRRYLDETLSRELRRADRERAPVSVLMLDIDRFKPFNDTYGHAAGDAVLREVAGLLMDGVRGEDVVCRYGGEELAVVMTGVDTERARDRAEALRSTLGDHAFTWHDQPVGGLTVSIGVATYPRHARSGERLMRAADAALYEAKRGGRDQVVCSSASVPGPEGD